MSASARIRMGPIRCTMCGRTPAPHSGLQRIAGIINKWRIQRPYGRQFRRDIGGFLRIKDIGGFLRINPNCQ